jgi:hypothetical protein
MLSTGKHSSLFNEERFVIVKVNVSKTVDIL